MSAGPRAGAGATRTCLLICTVPRSGSWLLADALEQTNRCGRPREYFRPDYQHLYQEAWGSPPIRSYVEYVGLALLAATTSNGVGAVKLHWEQFRHLLRRLREAPGLAGLSDGELVDRVFPDARYIYLVRRDKAAQAVSWYKAIHSDDWWRLGAHGDRPPGAIPPPAVSELRRLEQALLDGERGWQAYFGAHGIRPLVVTYEALSGAYRRTVRGVLEAVNLGGATRIRIAPPRLRRQADAESDRWIRRYRRERGAARARPAEWSRVVRAGSNPGV